MWKMILLLMLGLTAIVAIALVYGWVHWQSATREMHAKLEAARCPIGVKTFSPNELITLPAPVQRYFRTVLKEGQPIISAVRVEHSGTFNLSETGEQWRPFISTQRVITQRPGFDWDGRIGMAPGLNVFVHDAYVAGEGILHAKLLGLIPLADIRGTPEAAQGELMRFLAEAAWYPTALLPSQGVRWEAIDDRSARATLTDGATTVSLDFRFDDEGLLSVVRAAARYRTVKDALVVTPWQGRFWSYEVRGGMRIPLEGEVAWELPEGLWPYWRGRITKLHYEFAQ
jgi:hypothetical protein